MVCKDTQARITTLQLPPHHDRRPPRLHPPRALSVQRCRCMRVIANSSAILDEIEPASQPTAFSMTSSPRQRMSGVFALKPNLPDVDQHFESHSHCSSSAIASKRPVLLSPSTRTSSPSAEDPVALRINNVPSRGNVSSVFALSWLLLPAKRLNVLNAHHRPPARDARVIVFDPASRSGQGSMRGMQLLMDKDRRGQMDGALRKERGAARSRPPAHRRPRERAGAGEGRSSWTTRPNARHCPPACLPGKEGGEAQENNTTALRPRIVDPVSGLGRGRMRVRLPMQLGVAPPTGGGAGASAGKEGGVRMGMRVRALVYADERTKEGAEEYGEASPLNSSQPSTASRSSTRPIPGDSSPPQSPAPSPSPTSASPTPRAPTAVLRPTVGVVLLDGVDACEINLKDLRTQIGLVAQEPTLFNASVGENIAYRLLNSAYAAASDAEKQRRIEEACVQRVFLLSGGQKQRITITHAIVADPKILLLDEATSALDTASEGIVQRALDNAQAGAWEDVTIANRLSTVKDADAIYSTFRHSRKPPRLRRRPRRLAVLTEEQLAPCAAALGALFRASVRALNSPLVTEVLNAIRPGRGPGTHTRSATSMRYIFARGSASCWVAPGIFASLFGSVSAAACTTALPKIQEERHINIFRTIVIPTLFLLVCLNHNGVARGGASEGAPVVAPAGTPWGAPQGVTES
ncbi:hypothetical protein B0H13DRAFT_2502095 [Mycena leptocephala]|nr:hypothetical protein B0H13DRAFT_2502095 [Mycena leptocephala]